MNTKFLRGFSSLILLLVLAVLGVGAWFWYTYQDGPVPFPSFTPEAVDEGGRLTVLEWAATIALPSEIPDLVYETGQNGGIGFSSVSLTKLAVSKGTFYCDAGDAPLGVLLRYTTPITPEGVIADQDTIEFWEANYPFIDGYWYVFTPSQATCSDDKEIQALQTTQRATLSHWFGPVTARLVENMPRGATEKSLVENDTHTLILRLAQEGAQGAFIVKDKQTGKETMLENSDNGLSEEVIAQIMLDGTATRIAIDQGTSVSRGISIFSLADGKFERSFCGVGAPLFWQDYAIYRSCNSDLDLAGWEAGLPDVMAVNLSTGKETKVLEDHIGTEYLFYMAPMLSGNLLTVQAKKTYKGNNEWLEMSDETGEMKTVDLSVLFDK